MTTSFFIWVESRDHRPQVPETARLTELIATAGPAGVRLRDLRKAIGLDPDTLDDLLAALLAVGQLDIVSGEASETVYRAL